MSVTQPGHQRLVSINNFPIYLEEPWDVFPRQETSVVHYVQGGPRPAVYLLKHKWVKGSFQVPVSINPSGDIDPAVKEILLCAEYPLRSMEIDTNYTLSNRYFTDDLTGSNKGFGTYSRLAFDCCGITNLKLNVPNDGPVMLNVEFVGFISEGNAAVVPDPTATGMMRKKMSYADCDVYLETPEYHWDTTRSFSLTIANEIEPIIALLPSGTLPSALQTDQPRELSMGTSSIQGEIVYSVDRGVLSTEAESLPSGGLMGRGLIFDLSGLILIEFPFAVMHLTEQPIALDLLERKTVFEGMFSSGQLDETSLGHLFTFPVEA